jgi:hypothetical protein
MTKEEFLKFHSGYYGEHVDKISQITTHCFTGQSLFEYVKEALRLHSVSGREICACGKPSVEHSCKNCGGEIQYS